ncbi:MAG: hypothetical protein OXL96_07760 [Candidatus Poribacteria bacterium]|nr:hypothetical protein [Candidatus Poribacteria bacterium]
MIHEYQEPAKNIGFQCVLNPDFPVATRNFIVGAREYYENGVRKLEVTSQYIIDGEVELVTAEVLGADSELIDRVVNGFAEQNRRFKLKYMKKEF